MKIEGKVSSRYHLDGGEIKGSFEVPVIAGFTYFNSCLVNFSKLSLCLLCLGFLLRLIGG